VRDDANFFLHVFRVLVNPLGFVCDHQATLEVFVVRRDSSWASVLIALKGLDTAE
jgi:hypothetical protein